jgi:hypothetical protein
VFQISQVVGGTAAASRGDLDGGGSTESDCFVDSVSGTDLDRAFWSGGTY